MRVRTPSQIRSQPPSNGLSTQLAVFSREGCKEEKARHPPSWRRKERPLQEVLSVQTKAVWRGTYMVHACMLSRFSHVWLCATLWTVACQAPLSLGAWRATEVGGGQHFLSPELQKGDAWLLQLPGAFLMAGPSPRQAQWPAACSQIASRFVVSSVQFSHSVESDSLQPHGLQHARLPCPSPTPGAC